MYNMRVAGVSASQDRVHFCCTRDLRAQARGPHLGSSKYFKYAASSVVTVPHVRGPGRFVELATGCSTPYDLVERSICAQVGQPNASRRLLEEVVAVPDSRKPYPSCSGCESQAARRPDPITTA
jgi:hypothetical protein